jgi:hypothetical protein
MKKVLLFLITFVFTIGIFLPLKFVNQAYAEGSRKDMIVEDLSNILKDWYLKNYSTGFKNITINITLAEDIQPVTVTSDKAEAVFYLNAKMIPIMNPEQIEQSPFLIGMQKYLDESRGKLTPGQIETVKSAIEQKKELMNTIIGKVHEEGGIFKIICPINSNGEINKSSAEIFFNISPNNNLQWEDAKTLFTHESPVLPSAEEQNGYKEMDRLIKRLYNSEFNKDGVSANGFYLNLYNGYNAASYADRYTSNASYSNTITCLVNGTSQISHYTDITYWNNSQYPLSKYSNGYYEQLACNNCADFVSQSMYYGGMATDSYWNPQIRKTGYNGTWCWTYVPDLTDHMKQRGDWTNTSNTDYDYSHLTYGDVAVHWHYDSNYNVVRDHVVIVDYPYYSGTQLTYFSGHTNDVRGYPYPKSSSWYYYNVSCWRYQQ